VESGAREKRGKRKRKREKEKERGDLKFFV
jgi:hypothetical protein